MGGRNWKGTSSEEEYQVWKSSLFLETPDLDETPKVIKPRGWSIALVNVCLVHRNRILPPSYFVPSCLLVLQIILPANETPLLKRFCVTLNLLRKLTFSFETRHVVGPDEYSHQQPYHSTFDQCGNLATVNARKRNNCTPTDYLCRCTLGNTPILTVFYYILLFFQHS